MSRKSTLGLLVGLVATLMIILLIILARIPRFPSAASTEAFWKQYESTTDVGLRTHAIVEHLDRLRLSRSDEEDAQLWKFLQRLTKIYLQTHDKAIVDALAKITIDAGPGTLICDAFYGEVKSDPKFLQQCKDDKRLRDAMRRCEGGNLNHGETDKLISELN